VFVLSMRVVLEEGLATGTGQKNLTGNVKDVEALLRPETMAALAEQVPMLAFLAFVPGQDDVVAEYVRSGRLGADAGPDLLVLFNADQPATRPVQLGDGAFAAWLDVESTTHPATAMVRALFEPDAPPPLPGIAFFTAAGDRQRAVWVGLADQPDVASLQRQVRTLFAAAEEAAGAAPGAKGIDRLSATLQARRTDHVRTGPVSAREWFVRSYQFLGDNLDTLVSVVGLL
jgi:hypothetical protein